MVFAGGDRHGCNDDRDRDGCTVLRTVLLRQATGSPAGFVVRRYKRHGQVVLSVRFLLPRVGVERPGSCYCNVLRV